MRGGIQKKGPKYYAVVYDGVDPGTGRKRRRWVPAGTRRADAERLVADLIRRKYDGEPVPTEKLTLGKYLTERWLAVQKSRLRAWKSPLASNPNPPNRAALERAQRHAPRHHPHAAYTKASTAHRLESGLLTDDDVQVLAEWFVAGAVGVEVKAIAGDDIEGDLAGVGAIERPVWPPLRRWAAAALVEREPGRWRELLDATLALPSRDGDALAAGVMDAVANLSERDRGEVLAAGLAWGSGVVRLAALPGFADLEGVDTALSRAAVDPSVKVRSWKPARPSSAFLSRPGDRSEVHVATRGGPGQASLF